LSRTIQGPFQQSWLSNGLVVSEKNSH